MPLLRGLLEAADTARHLTGDGKKRGARDGKGRNVTLRKVSSFTDEHTDFGDHRKGCFLASLLGENPGSSHKHPRSPVPATAWIPAARSLPSTFSWVRHGAGPC